MGVKRHIYGNLSDEELLAEIKRDDPLSLEELYSRFWKPLYQSAFHSLRSAAEANDIVQEVFISFWLRRQEIAITTTLKAYLHTAVKYRVLNKASSLLQASRINTPLSEQIVESFASTTDPFTLKELERELSQKISSLPEGMRQVLQLSHKEQLTPDEIAQRLSISKQTVKNQLTAARKRLRLIMNALVIFILTIT